MQEYEGQTSDPNTFKSIENADKEDFPLKGF